MKLNLPVTDHENDYRDSAILISKTDAKGVITEVNQDFINVSGFNEDELVGHSHNVVRHPDMPETAFADLWRTVKKGKLWNGIVKNRCSNGDFYWVEANVTPVFRGDSLVGYVSVRTKPSREQVQAAASLYVRMKQGYQPRGLTMLHALRNLSIRSKLIGSVALLFGIPGLTMLTGLGPITGAMINLVFVLTVGPFLLRSIMRPLDDLRTVMLSIQGDGNLSRRATVHTDDEIGQTAKAFNALLLTLRGITKEVGDGTNAMSSAASQLSSIAQVVQDNSERQTGAVSETADAMYALNEAIARVSENVARVRNVAKESHEYTYLGNQGVAEMVGTIDMVEAAVREIASSVAEFIKSTSDITSMTKEVREISDQTNLLALNAAIEAARAGEAGRGFAVVADEVRKLSEKSANSARQIDDITKSIVQRSTEVKGSIEAGLEHLEKSQNHMESFSEVLSKSTHAANLVAEGMSDIAAAAAGQKTANEQIGRQTEIISSMIRDNASSIAETAAAAAHLREMAGKLGNVVGRFKA
jgi:aerotaxis receptor